VESEHTRVTVPPAAEVDNRMVQLALSSMATTLETIESAVSHIPGIRGALQTLENQHDVTVKLIGEAKGAANLAGGMAARALEEIQDVRITVNRIETAVGLLAQSMQGLEQASRSLIETVYPERDSPSTPPEIELADVVPIRRAMTGE